MATRFEVRLDDKLREQLSQLATARGMSASAVIRTLIETAHSDAVGRQRLQAVEELAAMSLEVPEDPTALREVLEATHEPTVLH
ncbi:MAG: ribbon-helix-helix protein, CopG family [Chloroflexi bacterium]|nr:ribbon-helix-helix protein, CopG family [Chloroflexota bacterium]MYD47879.1 ribbon-helix-helix protein, CopG family [Chloroflexota bacterium]